MKVYPAWHSHSSLLLSLQPWVTLRLTQTAFLPQPALCHCKYNSLLLSACKFQPLTTLAWCLHFRFTEGTFKMNFPRQEGVFMSKLLLFFFVKVYVVFPFSLSLSLPPPPSPFLWNGDMKWGDCCCGFFLHRQGDAQFQVKLKPSCTRFCQDNTLCWQMTL